VRSVHGVERPAEHTDPFTSRHRRECTTGHTPFMRR
jgi:hypothetical protein